MAAKKIIDLERERDAILFYEKRVIQERDEILKNLRKHIDSLDAEILSLGGRPRPELRQAGGRRNSSGSLRQKNSKTDNVRGLAGDMIAVAEKVRQSQAPKKEKRRKSFEESSVIVQNRTENSNLQPFKRPRGRPRKYPISVTGTTVGVKKPIRHVLIPGNTANEPKKKRRRPLKNHVARDCETGNSKIQNSKNAVTDGNHQTLRSSSTDASITETSSYSPSDSDSIQRVCGKKSVSCEIRAENFGHVALKYSGNTPIISNVSTQNNENVTLHTLAQLAIDGAEVGRSKIVDSRKNEKQPNSASANDETICSDGSIGKPDWTCNCGEFLPCTQNRCGKCHRWREGHKLRQRGSKLDKENSKRKKASNAKVTSTASVHEVYTNLSKKCVNDNQLGTTKFVMETMVSAVCYKRSKAENKIKKSKSGKKSEKTSIDKPKRKRGRPRKYPVMLIMRSRPGNEENNGANCSAPDSVAVNAKPANVPSAAIPGNRASSTPVKDTKAVTKPLASLSSIDAENIDTAPVKAHRVSSLPNTTSVPLAIKMDRNQCVSNSEVVAPSQERVEGPGTKAGNTKVFEASSLTNTTEISL
ncbi:hypothetical protein ACHAXS_011893 [Conticribra weissflogii]